MTDEIEMTALPTGEIEVTYADGGFIAASWAEAVKRIIEEERNELQMA